MTRAPQMTDTELDAILAGLRERAEAKRKARADFWRIQAEWEARAIQAVHNGSPDRARLIWSS